MVQRIEDIHCYYSRPFDIIVEKTDRSFFGTFDMTVVNNFTKEVVEVVKDVGQYDLNEKRSELIYKWLINLGQ